MGAMAAMMALAFAAPADAKGPAVRAVLAADAPLEHGEYLWDDAATATGPARIVVDLATEMLHVYRGGEEVGRAFILYGADHKPTPTGSFKILEKKRDHISNLYFAPMPYMLRLTWTGIAIHGSEVESNAATHGCIGVPDEFAARLFEIAAKGGDVLVTRNWRPDIYAAPLLPVAAAEPAVTVARGDGP